MKNITVIELRNHLDSLVLLGAGNLEVWRNDTECESPITAPGARIVPENTSWDIKKAHVIIE